MNGENRITKKAVTEALKTNKRIRKNDTRKTVIARRVFQKTITLQIVGTNVDEIQKTAQAIYALQTPETSGGKDKRKVQITPINSTEPQTVFYGRI